MIEEYQVIKLHKKFDQLQKIHGSKELNSIYGAGEIHEPDICFVFMNPTGRNVASDKSWKGIRAQWLGTKNIWKLFYTLHLIDTDIYEKIKEMKPRDWNEKFALALYKNIKEHNIYITNLGKCTQVDARPLPNHVFQEYVALLEDEIDAINPKVIITFGNQVSSIFLKKAISVSQMRKKEVVKKIKGKEYPVYPVYYPVGQGMRNIEYSIEDIEYIMKTKLKEVSK